MSESCDLRLQEFDPREYTRSIHLQTHFIMMPVMLHLQEALPDSLGMPTVQQVPVTVSGEFGIGSLLDLSSQAGGFQWPIFMVLVAGLLLLAVRFVQLLFDQHAARALRSLPLDDLQVNDLKLTVERSADSLYARLAMGMVELWGSGADTAALGQEVAHIARSAGTAQRRTERVITFLSGMAGGLGLLGTLVGIYVLFAAGARDAQTIFAGIGIAVISTLLGIVVSIVLELLDVLSGSWASRYMARAEAWATQLRYRLIEISGVSPVPSPMAPQNGRSAASVALEVEKVGMIPNVRPGQDVGPLGIRALLDGSVAEGVPVVFSVTQGGGRFSTGTQRLETKTSDTGVAAFTLTTDEQPGLNVVEACVEGERVRFTIPTREAASADTSS